MDTSRGFLLRLIERLIGVVAVLLFWPTMLLAYFLIRVTSNGPVVLTDEFPARGGGMARSYRLRTTGRGSSAFHIIGRFLRNYAIDELPAFLSLARGDIGLRDVLRFFEYR
jgi:lipopolysaccharide/colanic/teichoic acid biosynthesis glycosyltransferase